LVKTADVENKIAARIRKKLRGDHLAVRRRILESNGSQIITSSYKGLLYLLAAMASVSLISGCSVKSPLLTPSLAYILYQLK